MTLPTQFDGLASATWPERPVHLAIGMFDGVHLGHRAVLAPAVAAANTDGGIAAVLTFRPHPSALFRPDRPTRLIQDTPTKARVLSGLGIQIVVTERFTTEFAQIAAEEFLPWLKQQIPSLKAAYVGENFRFGHKRRGDVAMLIASGREVGVEVSGARRVTVHGEPASSTRIRAHLEAGEIEAANALLGYNYFSEGVISSGKRLGRTLGFPTLNLAWSPELRPRLGVYAVRVSGEGKASGLPGVANYGLRPTVESVSEPKLEVHVLGACPFDAGDRVTVTWLKFIRPEREFSSLDELKTQIGRDRETAAKELGV